MLPIDPLIASYRSSLYQNLTEYLIVSRNQFFAAVCLQRGPITRSLQWRLHYHQYHSSTCSSTTRFNIPCQGWIHNPTVFYPPQYKTFRSFSSQFFSPGYTAGMLTLFECQIFNTCIGRRSRPSCYGLITFDPQLGQSPGLCHADNLRILTENSSCHNHGLKIG